jgi:CheY-like chemotaxis protein
LKILVADDNRSIAKKVGEALKDKGHEVTGVAHGEAAVKKLPDFMPDLVLADVFMPVRNGYEVCEYIKKDARFSHIPVVLLVGAFDPVDQHEVKRVHADGLLKKPFDPPDDLLEMVRTMLEKSAQARPASEKKDPGKDADQTLKLSDAEMKGLLKKGDAAPAEAQPEPEEFSTRPARVEFGEGSEALSFGELLETPSEPAGPKVVEEEGPRNDASDFRASSIPEIEHAGEQAEAPAAEESVPPVAADEPSWGAMDSGTEEKEASEEPAAADALPETPQWGGVEVPAKEPSPDEPPIKVEFDSSEPIELILEESPEPVASNVDAGPLPELASSPDEFLAAAATPTPPVEAAPSSGKEVGAFSIPTMEEVAAPPATEEPIVPPPSEMPSIARPLEMDSTASAAAAAAPAYTGNTDAFGRPAHMNMADMDAIVEKVIERLQKGVLDKITRDILRPIVEALVAREVENKK